MVTAQKTDFGKLERVSLRDAWETEAGDFTPWLAEEENIRMLGDTINVELEIEAQEKQVGPFRADILCKDIANDHWVLIENQLERTDHSHLGQLLTYAAGLNAVTIVWIAERFTDEHRAALDWLNEMTGEDIAFFGLEVELWRIAESPVAPKFNIVSSPNDWVKSVSQGARQAQNEALTPKKELQLAFWSGFRSYVQEHDTNFKATKAHPQHWMNIAAGKSGVTYSAIASFYDSESETYDSHELRVELSIYTPEAKQHFQALQGDRQAIETAFGSSLHWQNIESKKGCKIFSRRSVDLNDEGQWPDYFEWIATQLDRLKAAFGNRIKNLDGLVEVLDE